MVEALDVSGANERETFYDSPKRGGGPQKCRREDSTTLWTKTCATSLDAAVCAQKIECS